jgi:hypothetical protein
MHGDTLPFGLPGVEILTIHLDSEGLLPDHKVYCPGFPGLKDPPLDTFAILSVDQSQAAFRPPKGVEMITDLIAASDKAHGELANSILQFDRKRKVVLFWNGNYVEWDTGASGAACGSH